MTPYEISIQHALWFMMMGMIARTLAAGHWTDYTHRPPTLFQYFLMVFAYVMLAYGFIFLGFLIIGPLWTAFMFVVILGFWILGIHRSHNDDDFDGD